MKNNENTQFMDNVIEVLKKAVIEVEEFQVQASLGKVEAQDKFEEIKKKFNLFIHDSKFKIKVGKEKIDDIHTVFDELRVQLALGKAETIEAFNAQKKQLLLTLHELEVKIKTNETLKRIYAFVLIEIEKFKIHLNTFEQRFNQDKDEAKISFEKGKQEFNQFIDNIKSKYTKKEVTKWEHFQDEVSEAFTHLKLAFAKP